MTKHELMKHTNEAFKLAFKINDMSRARGIMDVIIYSNIEDLLTLIEASDELYDMKREQYLLDIRNKYKYM